MNYTSRNPRFVTKQMIVVHSDTAEEYGLMIDLSKDGAQIESLSKLVIGEEVTLQILDQKVRAKIAWERDGKIGLSFDGSLSPETVSVLNKTGDDWVIY